MSLFRVKPAGPSAAYKTFRVRQPLDTHFRVATCAEVDCEQYVKGFKIPTDPATQRGQRQAYLIRESGRPFRCVRLPAGIVEYHFAPGTRCFRPHYRSLFREPLTLVQRGDWRTPARARDTRAMPAGEWLDRFGTHQQAIADQVSRG